MSIFNHDKYWNDTYQFVKKNWQDGDRAIAPREFENGLANTLDYSYSEELNPNEIQWVIIHKGIAEQIATNFLNQTCQQLSPVFANEVFVVFSSHTNLPILALDSLHIKPFLATINKTFTETKKDNSFSFPKLFSSVPQNTLSSLPTLISSYLKNEIFFNIKDIATKTRIEVELACRNNYQAVYLGKGIILCRVLTKYFCYIEADDIGIAPHLCLNGYWEMWIAQAILKVLQPGWHCVDIGANHGYYSLLMADVAGPSGCLLAVEPNPRIETLLKRTLEINGFLGNSTVVQKAVADVSGKTVNLVLPEGRGLNATISGNTDDIQLAELPITERENVFQVETITLDELTKDWQKVDLVKIDAEGAEEAIWQGMQQTIAKNKDINIVLEFRCDRYRDPKGFLKEILAAGFVLRHIDYDAQIKDLTLEECLTQRPEEDWMLFLRRR